MKVDVQGFEPQVFEGARAFMESGGVGALLFECEGKKLAVHNGANAASLYTLVRSLGFITMTVRGEVVEHDPNATMFSPCENGLPTNLVALHKKVHGKRSRRALGQCFAELHKSEIFFKFFYDGGGHADSTLTACLLCCPVLSPSLSGDSFHRLVALGRPAEPAAVDAAALRGGDTRDEGMPRGARVERHNDREWQDAQGRQGAKRSRRRYGRRVAAWEQCACLHQRALP
jgi:hypothetical protein